MPVSHIITISGTRLTVIVLKCLCLVTPHSKITLIFVHLTLSNHVVAASLNVTRKKGEHKTGKKLREKDHIHISFIAVLVF